MATKEHLKLEERVKIQSLIDSRYCRSLSRLAEEIGCNRSTIYREIKNNSFVKNGIIESVKHDPNHIECGIRKHFPYVCNGCTKEHCTKRVNVALLNGRMYSDYIKKINDGNNHVVLQIDTVFGKKTDKTCILTVFETKSRFQWGYVINQTAAQVNGCNKKLMNDLKNACGGKLFFDIILMDNGPEFEQVPLLEFDNNGVLNFQSYFCDPYRSGQKGGCERNHEFIRYMYRKGESISSVSQDKLDNLFSQINSLKRRSLQGKSSYDVFVELYGYIIAEIIGIIEIKPKEISFKKK